jgi:hypothetical protein
MVNNGETIIGYQNDRIAATDSFVYNILLTSGNTGRDQYSTLGGCSETCILMLSKEA